MRIIHTGVGRASQYKSFHSEKLSQTFSCAPDAGGVRTSGLWILNPTLCQPSHPVSPTLQHFTKYCILLFPISIFRLLQAALGFYNISQHTISFLLAFPGFYRLHFFSIVSHLQSRGRDTLERPLQLPQASPQLLPNRRPLRPCRITKFP